MPVYLIVIIPRAEKQLEAVAEPFRRRIRNAIVALADNPRPHGVAKIAGSVNEYRIRVGDFRVIYLIEDRVVTVTVTRIAPRDDVYRR